MASITEFLEERISDDEVRAILASGHFPNTSDWWKFTEGMLGTVGSNQRVGQAFRHVDRHSPQHVLAECAAKRAILALHGPLLGAPDIICNRCTDYSEGSADPFPCGTLQALAAVYVDHPDYNPEWSEA